MQNHRKAPRAHQNIPAQKPADPTTPSQADGVFQSLIAPLQRAVAAEGYTTPTPIQAQSIPPLLEGRDLLGSAQTGTGKTAAFALPLLQQLDEIKGRPERNSPRALILAPTRELAAQIGDSIRTYGRYLKLSHAVIFGGVNQYPQVKSLNRGVDILVATPGRLLDLMQQGHIRLKQVEIFVLDEVDRMLDMGFIPDIKRVLAKLPKERQTLFFSATLSPKMEELANNMVSDPVRVTITPEKPTVDAIEQKVLFVGKKNKDALLLSLLDEQQVDKALIFIQMKHAANKLVKKLESAGIRGTAIHGNKSQAARTKALDGFRRGRYRVMVATDVAARGLDVDDITHVINYDLPMEPETYVHRIGRTGRAGAGGDAISFCSAEDRAFLRGIENLLDQQVPADLEHEFHCEDARYSKQAPPKRGGGGGGGGGNRGPRNAGPRNHAARPRGRKRNHSRAAR